MRSLLYINDYLLLRSLRRIISQAETSSAVYYQKLPVEVMLPMADHLDLLVLHHQKLSSGGSLGRHNNTYLTEIIYPDLPVLVISNAGNAVVRKAFHHRRNLRHLPLLFSQETFQKMVSVLVELRHINKIPESINSAYELV